MAVGLSSVYFEYSTSLLTAGKHFFSDSFNKLFFFFRPDKQYRIAGIVTVYVHLVTVFDSFDELSQTYYIIASFMTTGMSLLDLFLTICLLLE